MSSKAYYLAIDPGKTTGWASFNEEGKPQDYGQTLTRFEVYSLLQEVSPQLLIIEDFHLFPWKSKEQAFSNFEEVKVIGACEHWAWINNAPVVLQLPNIKSIGYKWAGIPEAKSHKDSHYRDAYVHGVYYLQKNGVLQPQELGR